MGDFKIHHHVSELIKLFGITEKGKDGSSGDEFAEILERNRTPYVVTKVPSMSVVKRLAESTQNPEEVIQKYDELKLKQIREVDPLVLLLSQVQNDDKLKNLMKKGSERFMAASNVEKSNFKLNGHANDKVQALHRQVLSSLSGNKKENPDKRTVPQGIYTLPNWVRERPNISWNFNSESRLDFKQIGPVGCLPPNVQESRLIDDILFCLVGIDGDYIHADKYSSIGKRNFHLDESTNVALKEIVQNMVPMFSSYSTIMSFIEENLHYERGLVNHALSAAMRTFMKDYFILVSQLENLHLQHNLTLQKLWFYLQSSMATMETIANIASKLMKGKCFGGNVLTVLHNTASLTGSSKAQEICHALTRAASLPYFEILEKWIYKGIISDCYSEFLVEDNELIKKEDLPVEYSDAYWERRYTVKRDQIPIFLEKAADMILRTGKYLNVIRQCGKSVSCPNAKSIVYTMRESQYVECIEPAYHFASKKLLDLLMDDADLKGRLMSVKHYFLLDQGDFVLQFMDMAEEELQKDIDYIMPTRLESLLELALRTSVVNEDKYKDDVKIELLPYDLLTQMFKILRIPPDQKYENSNPDDLQLTGLEAFAFDYEVKWPLSLVINRKALACYQMLFRHLFYCKHIENLLGRVWTLNKRAKSLPPSEVYFYKPAFALRQRMLNFIQNLDYYLTMEVIEPHWHDFFKKISQVTNVDEVLHYHNDFLDKCLDDCMLTNPKLLQILGTLMKLCVDFSVFLETTLRLSTDISMMASGMISSIGEMSLPIMSSFPATEENFCNQVEILGQNFDKTMICMLQILHNVNQKRHTPKIFNLLYRLDFSEFYQETSIKLEDELPSNS